MLNKSILKHTISINPSGFFFLSVILLYEKFVKRTFVLLVVIDMKAKRYRHCFFNLMFYCSCRYLVLFF